MKTITGLIAINDNRKSFYDKAKVITDGKIIKLQSYNTIVAKINGGKARIIEIRSDTTLRHIKEFLFQQGFKIGTKKFLIETYMDT